MRLQNGAEPGLFGWMLLLAVALIGLAACTVYGEHPARSYNEATGGESLEQIFWKNVAAGNWTEVERALASNYLAVTPGGTLDRAAALEQYRKWNLKDYSLGDVKTEMNGETIVVTYTISLNGTAGTGVPAGPQHMMSVWQEEKKGWVIVAQNLAGPNAVTQNPSAQNPAEH